MLTKTLDLKSCPCFATSWLLIRSFTGSAPGRMSFTWWEVWQWSAKEVHIGDAMKCSEKLKAEKGLLSPSACYWPDHLGEVQHLGLSPLAFPRDEEAILVNLDDDYYDKVKLDKHGC